MKKKLLSPFPHVSMLQYLHTMKGEIIYEYGKNPVCWGRIENPDLTHREKNISCGEEITVDILFEKIKDKKNMNMTIDSLGFEAEGRLVTIAGMSLLCEMLEGEEFQKIQEITQADILDMMEVEKLSTRRLKSALLGLLTLRNAYLTYTGEPLLDFGDVLELS